MVRRIGRERPRRLAVDFANIELLADDASAGMLLLAKRPDVRGVVLNGHAAFMLLLSGPTASAHTQMRYERFHIGRPDPAEGPDLANVFDAFTGHGSPRDDRAWFPQG